MRDDYKEKESEVGSGEKNNKNKKYERGGKGKERNQMQRTTESAEERSYQARKKDKKTR